MMIRRPTLVLDNGETPDEHDFVYEHTGKTMFVTIIKTGKEMVIYDGDTLTLHGTAFELRGAQKQLDDYLAAR